VLRKTPVSLRCQLKINPRVAVVRYFLKQESKIPQALCRPLRMYGKAADD